VNAAYATAAYMLVLDGPIGPADGPDLARRVSGPLSPVVRGSAISPPLSRPGVVTAVAPSSWVLLAQLPGTSVYIDSNRIERIRPDTLIGVWLEWIEDRPIRASSAPNAGLITRIVVHSGIACRPVQLRTLIVSFYDTSGAYVGHHEFAASDGQRSVYDKMVGNVLPAVCAWLRDPTRPPVIVRE